MSIFFNEQAQVLFYILFLIGMVLVVHRYVLLKLDSSIWVRIPIYLTYVVLGITLFSKFSFVFVRIPWW